MSEQKVKAAQEGRPQVGSEPAYVSMSRTILMSDKKGKRQNQITDKHIDDVVSTYQYRKERDRYSRRVPMKEIADNDYNLNISRYVSTALEEEAVDLAASHAELVRIEGEIRKATAIHNKFLKELGLPLLPSANIDAK